MAELFHDLPSNTRHFVAIVKGIFTIADVAMISNKTKGWE